MYTFNPGWVPGKEGYGSEAAGSSWHRQREGPLRRPQLELWASRWSAETKGRLISGEMTLADPPRGALLLRAWGQGVSPPYLIHNIISDEHLFIRELPSSFQSGSWVGRCALCDCVTHLLCEVQAHSWLILRSMGFLKRLDKLERLQTGLSLL